MRHLLLAVVTVALCVPALAADPTSEQLDKAFKALPAFKIGANAECVTTIHSAVIQSAKDAARRADLEKRLVAVLKADATDDAKAIACRQLFILGTEASVPALAGLLDNPRLSHMARYALEKVPGEAATQALRAALAAAKDDKFRIGLVHTLGRRGDVKSVPAFCELAKSTQPELAGVALAALARLGGEQAEQAVLAAYPSAGPKLKSAAADACLTVAQRRLASGKTDQARGVYETLYAASSPLAVRIAALQGMLAVSGDSGAAILVKAMTDADPRMQGGGLAALRSSPSIPSAALAAELGKLPPGIQPQVVLALADRGQANALPIVLNALKSDNEAVRQAAIEALGSVGDAKCVQTLAVIAASKDKTADAARSSLNRMGAKGCTEAMIDLLKVAKPPVQVELIAALSARNAGEASPALLETASGSDEAVRRASFSALKRLAGPEQAPALVGFLLKGLGDSEAGEAESAALAAIRRTSDESAQCKPVVAAWPRAATPAAKRSLLRLMTKTGGKEALAIVKTACDDGDKDVKDAAVRALIDWPDAQPVQDVLTLAQCAPDETHKVLALRGFVRMIGVSDADDKQMIELYGKAMALAQRADEKKLVLAALPDLPIDEAKAMARECEKDPALATAAKVAVEKIEKAMKQPSRCTASTPDNVQNAVDGNPATRWSTNAAMQGGEWFMLDLGRPRPVKKIVLDAKGSGGDYPRGYEVYVSNRRGDMGPAVVKGEGKGAVTEITFPARTGRFVKIVQTGRTDGLFWSIHELTVE